MTRAVAQVEFPDFDVAACFSVLALHQVERKQWLQISTDGNVDPFENQAKTLAALLKKDATKMAAEIKQQDQDNYNLESLRQRQPPQSEESKPVPQASPTSKEEAPAESSLSKSDQFTLERL